LIWYYFHIFSNSVNMTLTPCVTYLQYQIQSIHLISPMPELSQKHFYWTLVTFLSVGYTFFLLYRPYFYCCIKLNILNDIMKQNWETQSLLLNYSYLLNCSYLLLFPLLLFGFIFTPRIIFHGVYSSGKLLISLLS
jgi:hypothetical protein